MVKAKKITSVENDSPWTEEIKSDNNEKDTEIKTLQALKPPTVQGRSPSSILPGEWFSSIYWGEP